MLTILFRNDGTGDTETGNYEVTVAVNGAIISRERIEDHHRPDGWRALVGRLAKQDGKPEHERELL